MRKKRNVILLGERADILFGVGICAVDQSDPRAEKHFAALHRCRALGAGCDHCAFAFDSFAVHAAHIVYFILTAFIELRDLALRLCANGCDLFIRLRGYFINYFVEIIHIYELRIPFPSGVCRF